MADAVEAVFTGVASSVDPVKFLLLEVAVGVRLEFLFLFCLEDVMINYGGKTLHNLIKLVLNASCQLGNFPSAWKFDDIIYLKKKLKSHTIIQSHIARSVSLANTLVKYQREYSFPHYCQA